MASALLAVPFFAWETGSIQIERVEVLSPRLPAAFDGFTIVQISDLHNKVFGPGNRRLLDTVAAQKPDLIALTGDLISRGRDLNAVPALSMGLSAIAPTYFVTGNHEWTSGRLWELKALLCSYGVTVLENESLVLVRGGASIVLAGAEDPKGRGGHRTPEMLMEALRAKHGKAYTLLLAHRNEPWESYDHCGAELILSGHAHGGVVRLPFTDGLVGHKGFFPAHTAGLYALPGGGAHMVSRGLGGARLLNRPHLPVIVLRSGEGTAAF